MPARENILRNFSRAAATYERWSPVQQQVGRKLLEQLPKTPIPQRILEVGCGTGSFTALLSQRFPQTDILALDLSPAMINEARTRSLSPQVRFQVADISQTESWQNGNPFDLVVANASLHWLADMGGGIHTLAQSLRTAGQLHFACFGPQTYQELGAVLQASDPKAPTLASADFPSRIQIESWLHTVFQDVSINTRHHQETFDSLLTLLRTIKYSGTQGCHTRHWRFTRSSINQMETLYRQQYKAVTASYEILYGHASLRRIACVPSS